MTVAEPSPDLEYPFEPKSNRLLFAGQFWGMPLSGGGWACGRVLGLVSDLRHGKTTTFIGALLDWKSEERPTAETIRGLGGYCGQQSTLHVKNIRNYGGTVDGWCELGTPDLPVLREGNRLFAGGTYLRECTNEDRKRYGVMGALNLGGIYWRAEQLLNDLDPGAGVVARAASATAGDEGSD